MSDKKHEEKHEEKPEAPKPASRPKLDSKTGAFLPAKYHTANGNVREDR